MGFSTASSAFGGGGGGGTDDQTLAEVLAQGAVTGGTDLTVTSGDVIDAASAVPLVLGPVTATEVDVGASDIRTHVLGWFQVGTGTDAVAIGDFAAGDSTTRLFYDASSGHLRLEGVASTGDALDVVSSTVNNRVAITVDNQNTGGSAFAALSAISDDGSASLIVQSGALGGLTRLLAATTGNLEIDHSTAGITVGDATATSVSIGRAGITTTIDGTLSFGDASTARTNIGLATVSQAEAEAGTATTERSWTAQRVSQAITALAAGGDVSILDVSVQASGQTISYSVPGDTLASDNDQIIYLCWGTATNGHAVSYGGTTIQSFASGSGINGFWVGSIIRTGASAQRYGGCFVGSGSGNKDADQGTLAKDNSSAQSLQLDAGSGQNALALVTLKVAAP